MDDSRRIGDAAVGRSLGARGLAARAKPLRNQTSPTGFLHRSGSRRYHTAPRVRHRFP